MSQSNRKDTPARSPQLATRIIAVFAVATLLVTTLAACGTYKPRPARVRRTEPVDTTRTDVVYMHPVEPSTRTVVSKNYATGARREAAVGEAMVGVRNYTAADEVVAAIVLRDIRQLCKVPDPDALDAARLDAAWDEGLGSDPLAEYRCKSGPLAALTARAGDRLEVGGAFSDQGKTYYLVRFPAADGGSLYVATDRRGRLRPGSYAAWRSAGSSTASSEGVPLSLVDVPVPIDDDGPLVRYVTEETVVPHGPDHLNYELIYRGTTYDHRGMVYHILYKEFRRDNVQVPIYTQDLPFTGDTGTVDVLGLRIKVHEANSRRIAYTVERD